MDIISKYEAITNRKVIEVVIDKNLYRLKENVEPFFDFLITFEEMKAAVEEFDNNLNEKRNIQFKLSPNFEILTDWVFTSDKDYLKEQINELCAEYLKFIRQTISDSNGLFIEYKEIDSDDFGTFILPKPVSKWLIKLTPKKENGFTHSFIEAI